jgi:hypothetical protein
MNRFTLSNVAGRVRNWKWNPVSIVGGILALASLTFGWVYETATIPVHDGTIVYGQEFSLFRILYEARNGGWLIPHVNIIPFLWLITLLIGLGGSVSLFHPAGGALSLASAVLFGTGFARFLGASESVSFGFAAGFYLALLGGGVSLLGFSWKYIHKKSAQKAPPAASG